MSTTVDWTTIEAKRDFSNAITSAANVESNAKATKDNVTEAVKSLTEAVNTFKANCHKGSKV